MEMTMQNRQLEILRAIVEEYVATEEPVGSKVIAEKHGLCLLYTSPSPRDRQKSRMPSSA